MVNKNSVLHQHSRYTSGGQTEVNMRSLEWWERKVFAGGEDDIQYVVEKRFEHQIASITSMFLNDPRLWWVIAQYNNILDPVIEIYEGRILLIPNQEKVNAILDGKIGGIPSTRITPIAISPLV